MTFRLGVDIGGTFTDFALVRRTTGAMTLHKQLTTPHDPAAGACWTGTREILRRAGVAIAIAHRDRPRHDAGHQRGDRAPRRRVGMLVTRASATSSISRMEQRYDLYDLRLRFRRRRSCRARCGCESTERIAPTARIEMPLDLRALAAAGPTPRRGRQDRGARDLLPPLLRQSGARAARRGDGPRARFPTLYVSASAEVTPFMREYERWTTTTVNAYAQPLVDRYLRALEDGLRTRGFARQLLIMTLERRHR